MNQIICPACGSNNIQFKCQVQADTINQCLVCGLSFSSLAEAPQIYQSGYFQSSGTTGYANYRGEFKTHYQTFSKRLKNAERKLGKPGVLLDVGCAYGHLGKTAETLGWKVLCTDISEEAVLQTHHDYNLPAVVSDLKEFPMQNAAFDLITLYDVLEHFRSPLKPLQALAPLLKANGVLHVTTPDQSSLSAGILGTNWYHYKPGEHFVYFDSDSLSNALNHCGFDVLETASAPSQMTLLDIFSRLRRYNKVFAELALRVFKILRCEDWVVSIPIGEMQAWAKSNLPINPDMQLNAPENWREIASWIPMMSCPSCRHSKLVWNVKSVECSHCLSQFPVHEGVPILITGRSRSLTKSA